MDAHRGAPQVREGAGGMVKAGVGVQGCKMVQDRCGVGYGGGKQVWMDGTAAEELREGIWVRP